MSALLDLHPTPGHPAVAVAAVHEVLDAVEVGELEASDYAGAVVEWQQAIRRMEAIQLKLVAAVEKSSVAADAGCASTAAWLSKQTRSGGVRAARDVRLAADLDKKLPATGEALSGGEVSPEHASVIAAAIRRLPEGLTSAQVEKVEARLVDKARALDPGQLRRVARRALEAVERDTAKVDAHEDEQLRDEEATALRKTRLTLHNNGDGTTSGSFTVPTLAAAFLKKILDAMTAPRRGRTGAGRSQAGDQGIDRDWAHERGRAFTELLEHLPTDRLHSKTAATVVVTLDHDTLLGQLKATGLDTGDLVSAGEARRLACNAGILPAVLGGQSEPLDLGRSRRLFSETQRVALGLHHATCVADGCERPYAWCELHHRIPWQRDGATDLANAVPLCGFHHRRIHDQGYLHHRLPDGSIRFHARR